MPTKRSPTLIVTLGPAFIEAFNLAIVHVVTALKPFAINLSSLLAVKRFFFFRVAITLTNTDKHTLPVKGGCPYAHVKSIAQTNRTAPCRATAEMAEPIGQADLRRCVLGAACPITDNRLQMSVNRDPR